MKLRQHTGGLLNDEDKLLQVLEEILPTKLIFY
jgi:hypothetical protein